MTIAYWCVLVAATLPYLWVVFAKSKPDYNNHAPREFLAQASGWRQRANWAQMNAFEAFPSFAAAVIIGHLTHGPQARLDLLAMLFIGARLAHGFLYMADQASLRSLAWTAGFACTIGILISGA